MYYFIAMVYFQNLPRIAQEAPYVLGIKANSKCTSPRQPYELAN